MKVIFSKPTQPTREFEVRPVRPVEVECRSVKLLGCNLVLDEYVYAGLNIHSRWVTVASLTETFEEVIILP